MDSTYGWEWFVKQFESISKINLTAYKRPQMERRINSFMKLVNGGDYNKFIALLRDDIGIYNRFIEHLTINVSEFFRNPSQWEVLEKEIIPALLKERSPLRVWSAGCSTGEEVYSLAMLLRDKFPGKADKILASDIDNEVMEKATIGLYTLKALQSLPENYKSRYLAKDGENYRLVDEIKKMVIFQKHDLLKSTFPQDFDLILCRNVVIYFTEESKHNLYRKFAGSLRPNGVLFIGSTEQIFQAQELGFKSIATFFYQKI
ncbi:MAG: protein-glutamate O-methyltransferase CheR [Syntrophomonas sp.]|nr:protein-glutamate O-methyltransferase CheR [Syntrophomonas sp.]